MNYKETMYKGMLKTKMATAFVAYIPFLMIEESIEFSYQAGGADGILAVLAESAKEGLENIMDSTEKKLELLKK